MSPPVRWIASAIVALILGFTLSFVLSPDPTGALPLLVGVIFALVLTPAISVGSHRVFSTKGAP